PVRREPARLDARERALAAALQEGLALVPRPYAALAARAGMSEEEAIARLAAWLESGIVKRLGLVVRHHELGYRANAMVVWDVPDERVAECGRRIAAVPYVTLCYRRARVPPQWCYNLYCMIHGRSRTHVLAQLAHLDACCDLVGYPYEVLFSRRRFKHTAARYVEATHG
ncbi:MAG TPA: Lrp/AsnC family transcriptional regulator, partial [Burkholderiales bacterium]|nr:Lrp/AsnC family transcriptional regulator [Burkholderiales bacterium]